jgi:hypothetical protein
MPTHNLTLTEEELFVLRAALEQFQDISDREYANPVRIAGEIEMRLPRSTVKWDDIAI